MNANRRASSVLLAAALGWLVPVSAQAASLKQVSGWNGGKTFPSDVSMYSYVPDKVGTNPPLVTIIHYCGGTARDVFGQAKDIVAAADQFGFVLVLPSSGRCWNLSSKTDQTRESNNDASAIAQMVRYALAQYKANPDRVYATGDSSGGMTTQLLMAMYPDLFKAGSSFAGVPAGCSNVFDGAGLCGTSAQTAQQWGDRVRAMYKDYSGHRPRVQLFHGDADSTIVYKNFGESIKQWTNVLDLSTEPTTKTDSGISLGSHQGKRQQWKNACGYVVLDGFTSVGGDHGPSDCLFIGKYVLPFLGLDSQAAVNAAVDPEIEQCSGGGSDAGVITPDAGKPDIGASGSGGTGGSGSGGAIGSGGIGGGTGGAIGGKGGGTGDIGGATGGNTGTGGKSGSGGGAGGVESTGGRSGSGGVSASSTSSSSSGGSSSAVAGSSSSSASGKGGASAATSTGGSSSGSQSSGGGCSMGTTAPASGSTFVLALGLALLAVRRRRR